MDEKFIKFLRKQMEGKTLGQIALISGVSKGYIAQIVTGKKTTPQADILRKLSKALPCTYEELMEAAGYIEPKPKTPPKLYTMAVLGRGGNIEEIEFTEEEIEAFKTLFKEKFNKGKNINE